MAETENKVEALEKEEVHDHHEHSRPVKPHLVHHKDHEHSHGHVSPRKAVYDDDEIVPMSQVDRVSSLLIRHRLRGLFAHSTELLSN